MTRRSTHPRSDEWVALVAQWERQVQRRSAEHARLRARGAALLGEADSAAAAEAPPPPESAPTEPSVPRQPPPPLVQANVVVVSQKRRRRPRAPVPGRRWETPDRIVVHAPEVCPHGTAPLTRGRLVQRRQVIEWPPVRAEVVAHRGLERSCRGCGTRTRGALPDLRAEVGGQCRVRWRVIAWVATRRSRLRVPWAAVRWVLGRVWGVRLSVGAVSALLKEAARAGPGASEGLLAEARARPVGHLDDTGGREEGQHGSVWAVITPTVRHVSFRRSRAGVVARRLLGDAGESGVISACAAADEQLEREPPRGWAHLLRDVRALVAAHPDDRRVGAWAQAVNQLSAEAGQGATAATAAGTRPILRERAADQCAVTLVALGRRQPAESPQAVLCPRIERYHTELFTFGADPAVPPTNNAAARGLRPLVIARKISGGTRSKQGSRTRMVLQSLAATWELRGRDPVAEFLALLRAPRPTVPEFAPV